MKLLESTALFFVSTLIVMKIYKKKHPDMLTKSYNQLLKQQPHQKGVY